MFPNVGHMSHRGQLEYIYCILCFFRIWFIIMLLGKPKSFMHWGEAWSKRSWETGLGLRMFCRELKFDGIWVTVLLVAITVLLWYAVYRNMYVVFTVLCYLAYLMVHARLKNVGCVKCVIIISMLVVMSWKGKPCSLNLWAESTEYGSLTCDQQKVNFRKSHPVQIRCY